ncbi:EAL domain-containing protein [Thiomicrorhabdus sp.]|uniref:EAL domain-containing protein n=1 Tax=Thiomicrorhabdus sp. TaxID=2039724 RepID=UPI002AA8BD33|nr:EAL domain-containing protein [Thiomicrorhabdus sp.]
MFVSIRWKAVILLSFILFIIAFAWIFQGIFQNIHTYEFDIEQSQESHQKILDQLITDNYIKLSQHAQLIIDNPKIKNYQKTLSTESNEINDYLKSQWYAWNLNISIDYVAVIDGNGKRIAEANQAFTPSELQSLRRSTRLFSPRAKEKPQNFIFCESSCIQFVMEPFIFSDGHVGILTLGQNMSDLITRYHAVSSSDLAVLIQNNDYNKSNQSGKEGNLLKNWNVHVWAITRFNELYSYVENFSKNHSMLETQDITLWNLWNTDYFLRNMVPSNYIQVGSPAYFMSIINESKRQEQLKQEIIRGVSTSLVGWILAETLLIFLMMGPIQRLLKIVQALELLPKHRYKSAISLIKTPKKQIRDEITQLEDSTVYLANELENLHLAVEISEEQLKNQILMLTRSKEFLQRLFDNANLYILTQSFNYEVATNNHLFSNSFDTSEEKSFLELFLSSYDKTIFIDGIIRLKENPVESFQQEASMKTIQGVKITLAWTHTLVKDDEGRDQVLSIGMDITQRKNDEMTLNWLANNDSLTKIGNRRAFKKDLDRFLSQDETGALVFIDVNRFKQINDIYGHLAGDTVLIDIAKKLKENTRNQDSICRLAGDEFTILMPGVSIDNLPGVLESLSDQLNQQITLSDSRVVEYSVSLGGAVFPDHGSDEQALIVHSDMAMYQAKKKGLKNWHIFSYEDDQLSNLQQEHDIMRLLRLAIKNDLFTMVYQPILDIKQQKVSHYESLIRLQNEEGEWISPGIFIPIAERVGLIRDVDSWVIEHVFSFMKQVLTTQPDLCFSINISAPSLQEKLFAIRFSELIREAKIPAQNIIIELTETAYIENFVQVLKNLEELTKLGVSIALDDFGVGYSSFSYMKKLPLKYVKLDGSYVRNIVSSSENSAFIQSVVIMAQAFGMKTIAEFVENQEVLNVLAELNVDYAQGYHIGKPNSELTPEK